MISKIKHCQDDTSTRSTNKCHTVLSLTKEREGRGHFQGDHYLRGCLFNPARGKGFNLEPAHCSFLFQDQFIMSVMQTDNLAVLLLNSGFDMH